MLLTSIVSGSGFSDFLSGREVNQILTLAGNFARLSQETRDAMEYYILERPTRDVFDKKILRYRGLSVWMLKSRIRQTLPVLDGAAYALEIDSTMVPVVDLGKATRVIFASPALAELYHRERKPAHLYQNWVPPPP